MTTNAFEKRLAKQEQSEREPTPHNPLSFLAAWLLAFHPRRQEVMEGLQEFMRTGEVPDDPLLRAMGRVTLAAEEAVEAGLFASEMGEVFSQAVDTMVAAAAAMEAKYRAAYPLAEQAEAMEKAGTH